MYHHQGLSICSEIPAHHSWTAQTISGAFDPQAPSGHKGHQKDKLGFVNQRSGDRSLLTIQAVLSCHPVSFALGGLLYGLFRFSEIE